MATKSQRHAADAATSTVHLRTPAQPSATLTARVCAYCGKGKKTICYRDSAGAFFAHLACFRRARAKVAGGVK